MASQGSTPCPGAGMNNKVLGCPGGPGKILNVVPGKLQCLLEMTVRVTL